MFGIDFILGAIDPVTRFISGKLSVEGIAADDFLDH